jgi:hypothetical protein
MDYHFYYKDLTVVSRRDGIVVQLNSHGEASGWNDDREDPDTAEAEECLRKKSQVECKAS